MRLFLLIVVFITLQSFTKKTTFVVYNDLNIDRKNEMVEISTKDLGIRNPVGFILSDASGKEVPYQVLSDSQTIIFQASVGAKDSSAYTITMRKPAPVAPKVFGRHVPERKDDFAWENDRIAFRMYGPALAAENPSNGVDVWLKRTDRLIVNQFYTDDLKNKKSYHVDHGEGLDCYKVGNTLGAGGIAPYTSDGKLWVARYYNRFKLLEKGPLRVSFTLEYDSLQIHGQYVRELLTITLDAGSQLNKATVVYEGEKDDSQVATGIYLHDQTGQVKAEPLKKYIAYAENVVSDAGIPSGRIYVAVYVPEGIRKVSYQDKHVLAISNYTVNKQFTYYFGAGWSKWGFSADTDWFNYIDKKAQTLQSSMRIKARK
jgi:hypothetical protein